MEKPWKTIHSESLLKTSVFEISKEKCELPDGRIMPAYFRIACTDWVNVIPFTKEGKIIMLRQYRHGSGEWNWELPGGALSPRTNEDPLLGAQRELLEETGCQSKRWEYKGAHRPNPALQNNKMHTFVAYDCEKTSDLELDPYEDLTIHYLTQEEVKNLIHTQQITHSLMLASLVYGFLEI